ncbi:MAG: anti-anti-sigma factor [Bacteroidetes bacterium]|nr:MAG: anti-anti-sigma factor [Bacteroidota bacterium]
MENLNSSVSPELKAELVLLNKKGEKNLVIDINQTKYCDSSGLSAILLANRLCRDSEGTFVLTGVNEQIQKLIEISQLDRVLHITPTLSEAVDFVYMEEIERNLGEVE